MIQDAAGNLYGTTSYTVFKIAGPFPTLSLAASAFTPSPVSPGASSSSTVTVTTGGGFSGVVNLGVNGLPAGATGTFNPTTVMGSGSSTLTVKTSSSTPVGSPILTITGTSGSLLQSTEATLTVALVPDFTIATTPSTQTVTHGGTAGSTVNVGALNGLSGSVALACTVQPSPALAPQCSIVPSSTTPGIPAMLTVSTTPSTVGAVPFGSGLSYAVWLPLMGLVAMGVGFGSQSKRKADVPAVVLACSLCASLIFVVACGGSSMRSSSSGTPAGTYTITVTGTSGSLQHSAPAMLKVQ